jgi:hypothetical protein
MLGVADDSMRAAFQLAKCLGRPPEPVWLGDVAVCVQVVEGVERNGMDQKTDADHATFQKLTDKLNVIFYTWAQDPGSVPDVDDVLERQNVLLRLWAGCTDTAKTIKYQTRDPQPTSPELRGLIFREIIDPQCGECPVYAAGSRAAVAYMVGRGQADELCFDGVPEGSLVKQQQPRLR